jgi:hypothetical protein
MAICSLVARKDAGPSRIIRDRQRHLLSEL